MHWSSLVLRQVLLEGAARWMQDLGGPIADVHCSPAFPNPPPPTPPPCAAEVWFSQHGVPCPGGTAIAEHMLHVASDAPMTRHLLLALDQEQAADAGDGTRGARVTMAPPSPPSPPHLDDSAGASLDGEGKASADSAEKLGLPTEGLAVPAPSPFEGPLAAGASQLYGSAAAVEGPRHRRSTTEDTMGTEWSEAQKGGAAPPRRG